MKQEREFFDTTALDWQPVVGSPGVSERVLSRADDVILTRLARWDAGLDTTPAGVIRHDYIEEVYLLDGELTDLTLVTTFRAGEYACRPVGMPHGPYRTDHGCLMLEIRYPDRS
jgi:hypothetical protein